MYCIKKTFFPIFESIFTSKSYENRLESKAKIQLYNCKFNFSAAELLEKTLRAICWLLVDMHSGLAQC